MILDETDGLLKSTAMVEITLGEKVSCQQADSKGSQNLQEANTLTLSKGKNVSSGVEGNEASQGKVNAFGHVKTSRHNKRIKTPLPPKKKRKWKGKPTRSSGRLAAKRRKEEVLFNIKNYWH